jgi:hypothetical protein
VNDDIQTDAETRRDLWRASPGLPMSTFVYGESGANSLPTTLEGRKPFPDPAKVRRVHIGDEPLTHTEQLARELTRQRITEDDERRDAWRDAQAATTVTGDRAHDRVPPKEHEGEDIHLPDTRVHPPTVDDAEIARRAAFVEQVEAEGGVDAVNDRLRAELLADETRGWQSKHQPSGVFKNEADPANYDPWLRPALTDDQLADQLAAVIAHTDAPDEVPA